MDNSAITDGSKALDLDFVDISTDYRVIPNGRPTSHIDFSDHYRVGCDPTVLNLRLDVIKR